MEREVAGGCGVGVVVLGEALGLGDGDGWNLGLVGVERERLARN
jgi:hypothetical protein